LSSSSPDDDGDSRTQTNDIQKKPTNPFDFTENWMLSEGNRLTEGNRNESSSSSSFSSSSSSSSAPESFEWRGGKDRQTTGIWMWSEPFTRKCKVGSGVEEKEEEISVLLMDTQGMFDNETSMTLTAQIFGLSTFVSSMQIYNVDKRLQEDDLQHLALFSEYGRIALGLKTEVRTEIHNSKSKSHRMRTSAQVTPDDVS